MAAWLGAGTVVEALSGGTLDVERHIANAGAVEALAVSPNATAAVTVSGSSIGNSGSLIASAGAALRAARA